MNRRLRSLLVVPATVLLVAACGSGSGGSSDDAEPYVEAMATSITDDEDSPMDEKQARCFSKNFIDVVGIDKIKKAGTPEEFADESDDLEFDTMDLTREQGEEIYAQFDDCGIDLRAILLEDMLAEDDMTPEAEKCVEGAVTDEKIRDFFVTMMISGEDAATADEGSAELGKAMMTCMMGDLGAGE